jgi:putative ABC transport system permease protein
MTNVLKIAMRNLFRYKRRTLLTMALIVSGMVFVLVFVAVTGSFKNMMVGQITDSFVGHAQIHKRGYLASIDNLPLQLNLQPQQVERVEEVLSQGDEIEAYSVRIKFGAAFSNYQQTTNIRINGVDPAKEFDTCPLLLSRVIEGKREPGSLDRGKLLIPVLLARGMGVKVGDTAVVIATNRDGSVNGGTFIVGGILESATGPGGRDGYMHIEDARELLRITDEEASEFAIRVKDFDRLNKVQAELQSALAGEVDKQGRPIFEVHTWERLSPFSNIADMIDVMTFFVKLMLVSVVLISIMNVMIMAIYERIREIGTIAAIGTVPSKILSLYVTEGLLLGVMGAASGTALGAVIVFILNLVKIGFAFGRQDDLLLAPTLGVSELVTVSLLVIGVAVVASLQPAWKASRMEPIDALRHV